VNQKTLSMGRFFEVSNWVIVASAGVAGLRGEQDVLGNDGGGRSGRPCHAQAELEGRKGLRPLGFPS